MSPPETLALARATLFGLVCCASSVATTVEPPVIIEADAHQIHFQFPKSVAHAPLHCIQILQSACHSGFDGRAKVAPEVNQEVWSGPPSEKIVVPRFVNGTDLLFSKFHFILENHSIIPPKHVTRINIAAPTRPLRAISKKGITCGIDSPVSPLHRFPRINQNIDIAQLLAHAPSDSPHHALADHQSIPLNEKAVKSLDFAFQRAKKAGQEVTGILLAYQRKVAPLPPFIVHPLARAETLPIGPAAFDTASEQGLLTYRAVVGWLADRYGNPDAEGGSLEGLVIGNEIQSHWSWYHLGHASKHLVLNEYAIAVRTADLAMRSRVKGLNAYISLDHHWMEPADNNPLRGFGGRDAIETLNRIFSAGGDFPWHVAFHPYPEDLFNPAFWNDTSATPDFESPKITFKNLEVLSEFLRQPEFQFEGKCRRIALTEQGFHCPKTEDGPALQAAAFALAWKKVQTIPEISIFLYHRHVDHPHENGLRCGLFAHDETRNSQGVGSRRPIADLLDAAGTAAETEAFAPYLAFLGLSDWTSSPMQVSKPLRTPPVNADVILLRLVNALSDGKQKNLADVSVRKFPDLDATLSPAIRTHPTPASQGTLTFRVSIPDAPLDTHRTVFRSTVLIEHAKSTGGTFSLWVNDALVLSKTVQPGRAAQMEADLTQWSGQTISLALGVHPDEDPAYDWMTWGDPSIILKPSRPDEKPVHSGLSRP